VVGAEVTLTSGPAAFKRLLANQAIQFGKRWAILQRRADRVRTGADGSFVFLDLPAGMYTLEATLNEPTRRFGTARARPRVTRDDRGSVTAAVVDVVLPSTIKE